MEFYSPFSAVLSLRRGIRKDFYDFAVSTDFQKRLRVPLRDSP